MKLINEDTDFKISTTGAVAEYSDDGKVIIRVCAELKHREDLEIFPIEIHFQRVAELVCRTINFYKSNYDEFEIVMADDEENEDEELTGFYRICNSPWLEARKEIYDPEFYKVINQQTLECCNVAYDSNVRLNLKHYLVAGADGYFELLASGYSVVKFLPDKISTSP